ncbi:MAG: hypothetical protein C4522_00465 [Desulfobacteraceae bacterium]|nr:MAG: hypothetical protein C4522_00465 [Desulfobacteraceae bacterium]
MSELPDDMDMQGFLIPSDELENPGFVSPELDLLSEPPELPPDWDPENPEQDPPEKPEPEEELPGLPGLPQ